MPDDPIEVLYVSYDGALDPLGASQVVSYLVGLARRGVRATLVSFEKPEQLGHRPAAEDLAARLKAAGIRWRPLRYHRRPRLPATLWDIARGRHVVGYEARRARARIVHCRGDVAMLMARTSSLPRDARLLYDIRGFFSDERVESGSWERGTLLDTAVRAVERRNLERADGLVVLTQAALAVLAPRRLPLPPHAVIPTCVDLDRFPPVEGTRAASDYAFAYLGSLGTWYMTAEMVAFGRLAAATTGRRTLFLTPEQDVARAAGVEEPWGHVASSTPGAVADWLARVQALFFFIRPTPAKRASCPTKLGEALAAGLPVVTNRGVGDVDSIVEDERVGVLVGGFDEHSYRQAIQQLELLRQDPDLPRRCRETARRRFGLDVGVAAYHDLYDALIQSPHRARP